MIRHIVRRGDSLYSLAGQYLGSGTRWPEIDKFHNEFALGGKQPQLLLIKDPNLIFVGQVIFIPPRSLKPYTLTSRCCPTAPWSPS
ncbi:MAG: LysM peptidoglycan-binding domain-containing protein [Desulfatitalea sp.]